jgi:CO dehydrogenase/acetyl-CoA synthase beta subunit
MYDKIEDEVIEHLKLKDLNMLREFIKKKNKKQIKLFIEKIEKSENAEENMELEEDETQEDPMDLKRFININLDMIIIDQIFQKKIGFEIYHEDFKFGFSFHQKTFIFLYG